MAEKNKLDRVAIRMVEEPPIYSKYPIKSPNDAVAVVGDLLREMDREMICVINLKTNGIPINCDIVSVGSLNYSLVHPREILKSTVLSNAASVLLVHNHPSGSPQPSLEDLEITRRMIDLYELMDIPLLDHVIIGNKETGNYSMLEHGEINNLKTQFKRNWQEWQEGALRGVRERAEDGCYQASAGKEKTRAQPPEKVCKHMRRGL